MENSLIKLTLASICLAIFSLIISGWGVAAIDPATCMGAWLFDDEGEEIEEDISGNENHGTLKGDPEWDNGKFGMALVCDGANDFADCGDKDTLDVGEDNFSIVAWIKCADYDPSDWEAQIVYKFDHTAPRHGYLLGVRGDLDAANMGKPFVIMGLGDSSGIHLFGTSPINDDTWHHLAMTVDRGGSMILYRDGELESQMSIVAYAGQNEDTSISFNIGSQADSLVRTFRGLIDEVALFKDVLTQDDIQRIMTQGLERALGQTPVSPAGKLTNTWAGVKSQH
jgi:hypothetical protein